MHALRFVFKMIRMVEYRRAVNPWKENAGISLDRRKEGMSLSGGDPDMPGANQGVCCAIW